MWPEIVLHRLGVVHAMTCECLAFEVVHQSVKWPTSVRPLVGEDCSHPHFVLGWSGGPRFEGHSGDQAGPKRGQRRFDAVPGAQLAEHRRNVSLDGRFAEEQLRGDVGVRGARRE